MAADLKVDLGGLSLKNPFVVASGDIGCHMGQIREAEGFGAAAFIIKGCIPVSGAVGLTRRPRFRVDLKKGILSGHAGVRRLGLDDARRLIATAKKEVKIPIGANIFVMVPTDEEKHNVVKAAKELYESGADLIELDTTGNLPVHFGETGKEKLKGEHFLDETAGKYPGFVHDVIKSVKQVVSVPVMGKIAYENLNVPVMLQAMEGAGIDIIDIGNGGLALVPGNLDIYHPEKRWGGFETADKSVSLSLTGEPLRMIALGYILRAAKSIKTPILGCGGIMDWPNAVEAIMCGATAVASCTLYYLRGFGVIPGMISGLKQFIEKQSYTSLADFRGIVVDKLALNFNDITVLDAVARVDPAKCNGCGLCIRPAQCGIDRRAISMVDSVAVVDETQCHGCETCASICPVKAVSMVIK